MVPFIIYWGVILACIAWLALSIYFSIFYLARKENGNLWAFAFFNVLAAIVLVITLVIYRTWGWGITQYSSLIYLVLAIYGVTIILQAILGREKKVVSKPA
jgi:hypothetical protein